MAKRRNADYEIDSHGIIRSPGKFEGEPRYVPYFWDAYLNGMADDDDGVTLTFDVNDDDRKLFPELEGVKHVYLEESDQGFVYSQTGFAHPTKRRK
jgi:hypothetical protein